MANKLSIYSYFDRDISWLYFNERVLTEAARDRVPLLERIKFLSIFSSNLDEFYRVRMPVMLAIEKLNKKDPSVKTSDDLFLAAKEIILKQQQFFGRLLRTVIIPEMKEHHIQFIYGDSYPTQI